LLTGCCVASPGGAVPLTPAAMLDAEGKHAHRDRDEKKQ
jgi:hypothetical protein